VADRTEPAERRRAGWIKGAVAGSRDIARIVYRDPEHVAERLTLLATQRLGESAHTWGQEVRSGQPDVDLAAVAAERRKLAQRVALIDGAIAGTPFFVALIPGYLDFLWQQTSMVLRLAALYGHDPRTQRTAAELLAVRGVHPSVEDAEKALVHARARPMPDKPERRRSLRTWARSVRMLLVFGGFLAPPSKRDEGPGWRQRLLALAGLMAGVAIWAITWVFPITFMIAMAWGCESNTRDLFRRTQAYYTDETSPRRRALRQAVRISRPQGGWRRLPRGALILLSILIPIAFVAYADHVRNQTGITPLAAVGALVALSLVIATAVAARRG
jgi:hypothetical protein